MVFIFSRGIIVAGDYLCFSIYIKPAARFADSRFSGRHGREERRSASLDEAGGGRPA